MSTAENVRYHAAGHLASAHALAAAGHVEASSLLLGIVRQYLARPRVQSPGPLRETLDQAIADPAAHISDIEALERMFCDNANTMLEQSGINLGNG